MSVSFGSFAPRRPTVTARVRGVAVGSSHPVVVQSMTNTDTADAAATAEQTAALFRAGSQIVRVTVNNDEAAAAVPELRARLDDLGLDVPLVRDFKDVYVDAMLESALRSAALAEEAGLGHDRILISAKVSQVQDLVTVYRRLAARCDYPLHLGLTEAGLGTKGVVASTAGLAILLAEGIGDTIRVSLTPRPGGDRTEEVHVAQQILQSLGLRSFAPQVTSCPGCGRTTSTFFQRMAEDITGYIREQMPVWRARHPGVERMNVA